MEEKNTLRLCMRYGGSCRLCPRNKKCDEEIEKERRGAKSEKRRFNKNDKRSSKRFRQKSRRYS